MTTETKERLPQTAEPKAQHPLVAMKGYIDQRVGELQFALPPHISPDRFTRVVMTALQQKPDLLKCTRQSLWNACLRAAQDGLLPDGREGAIAPYGESTNGKRSAEIATWMPMIEGLRKKARNSGDIRDWYVEIVYAGDEFDYQKGDSPRLYHKPVPPSQRIKGVGINGIVAAYSIAVYPDGTKSAPEVMWVEEIEAIRSKSKAQKGPWSDPVFYSEMAKKTVARRHYKSLPHSSDLDDIMQRDDEAFGLQERGEAQIADRQQKRVASIGAALDQFAGPPMIEHDDGGEPSGDQDDFYAAPENDGEFDDAPTPPAAQNAAAQGTAGAKQAAAAPRPQENVQPAAPPDDAGIDADARHWPEGQTPTEPDEYQFYCESKLETFTQSGEVGPWWRSEAERRLRNECGVTKEMFEALQAKAKARAEALAAGRA